MQLSERQQSKSFVRNIDIVMGTLENVCTTTRRTCFLHNQNLISAMPIIIRGAENRADVTQDPDLQKDLRALQAELTTETQVTIMGFSSFSCRHLSKICCCCC
jgi:hypothetical protein